MRFEISLAPKQLLENIRLLFEAIVIEMAGCDLCPSQKYDNKVFQNMLFSIQHK